MSQQDPLEAEKSERVVGRVLSALRQEYIVVGKTRVRSWHAWLLIGLAAGIAAGIILVANRSGEVEQGRAATFTNEPQYLIFQIFTYGPNAEGTTQPFDKAGIEGTVDGILAAVDNNRGDGKSRILGFSVGPLSLDHTDEELRTTIRESFQIAKEKNVAVAFHIDDSMFWIRRNDLWQNPDNVEWTDWNKTVHPHRIIGWTAGGAPILAPPMCYTSPTIRKEIARIAKDVIGSEIKNGINLLKSEGKEKLFAGVISGWETRLDDDSNPKAQFGYCALHNLGYSAAHPPKDFDSTLENVVHDWVALWAKNLVRAGIPKKKIYSHIAVTDTQWHAPLSAAFNEFSRPGFTVYLGTNSQKDTFAAIHEELNKHGNPLWSNSEGTNVDFRCLSSTSTLQCTTLSTISWDEYLADQFNRGANFVNIFGWPAPPESGNPFGISTHSQEAIAAYKKFLSGGL